MATNWSRLSEPFPADDVEWRVAQAGKKGAKVWARVLAYITARAIHDRLDEVFGPGGWKNEYKAGPNGGVLCRIYFKDDAGEWVWREDGAENTDIEAVKGGISGATKRAGSALGIGRYLYHLEEGWANIHDNGAHRGKTKDGEWFSWDPPPLPSWALPGGSGRPNGTEPPPSVGADGERRSASMSDAQRGVIEGLLESRDLTGEEKDAARKWMDAGPTYEGAKAFIAKLTKRPKVAEGAGA